MRKTMLLLLALMLMISSAFPALAEEAAAIRGYSKSGGYEYVLFGAYPTEADGTLAPIFGGF